MQKEGITKSIGVSNFTAKHLNEFLKEGINPNVNQIEVSPMYMDKEAVRICRENGIQIIAYAPLGTYDDRLMKNPTVLALAAKYSKQAH